MRSRLAFLFLALALALPAAPLTRDLGQNLALYRLKSLPGDLPATDNARRQPTILDVRYLKADASAAAALQTWLRAHAAQRTPVFVLANATTAPALLDLLATKKLPAHTLVIGIPTPGFTPDIAITDTADNERRAYDALDAGTEVAVLLSENTTKPRNDEASLSRPPRFEEQEADNAGKAASPPPLDLALQRAVHMHRALVALRKL